MSTAKDLAPYDWKEVNVITATHRGDVAWDLIGRMQTDKEVESGYAVYNHGGYVKFRIKDVESVKPAKDTWPFRYEAIIVLRKETQ